jgi:putative oxidoreductase
MKQYPGGLLEAHMLLDLGLLVLRLVVGGIIFGHGAQKLLGWFGGPGLAAATGMFGGHLRLRPAGFWALLGSLTEVVGGLLLVLGLLNSLGSAAVVAAMLMAVTVHWPKFWANQGGSELALIYLAAALTLGLTGAGAYSLDAALGLRLPEPATLIVGLVGAVVGVGVALGTRAPAAPTTSAPVAAAAH